MKNLIFVKVVVAVMSAAALASCSTANEESAAVTSISLDQTELTVDLYSTTQLTLTVTPSNAQYDAVEWISSSESVVSVDGNGLVTAEGLGEATVTARVDRCMAQCHFEVVKPVVTGISLDQTSVEILVDETLQLVATVTPETLTDVTVIWESSNASIANVNQGGLVTGNGVGEAEITASAGDFSAVCIVKVLPIEAESVTLNKSEITLEVSDSERLIATVGPVNTTDKTVSWTTSDDKIAAVDGNGTVTAVAEGEAVITAACGKASGSCKVTVTPMTGVRYNIGDIIEVDGHKAFVFYITDNGRHGKAMSEEYTTEFWTYLWSSETVLVGASSTTDGRENTEKVKAMPNYETSYSAFKWIEDTFGPDWYMPAQEEAAQVFTSGENKSRYITALDTSTELSASTYAYVSGSSYSDSFTIEPSEKLFGILHLRAVCEF